jgi:hypothetical protein
MTRRVVAIPAILGHLAEMGNDGNDAGGATRRRFHTVSVWWVLAIFYGFIGLLTAGAALNPNVPTAGRVTCAVLALGVILVLVLGWRAGVEVDRETVTVRTDRGTSTTIPWAEVSRFELVSNGSRNGGVYVATVDRSGRRHTTQGLAGASPTSARAQRLIAELEALRPRPSAARGERK